MGKQTDDRHPKADPGVERGGSVLSMEADLEQGFRLGGKQHIIGWSGSVTYKVVLPSYKLVYKHQ